MDASDKWDTRFLALAREVGTWSKDPSTQVGAVVVRPDKTIASLGFNGFPRGMDDRATRYLNREDKYARIIHAEVNALLTARELLHGYTLYCSPLPCCHRCAVQIIQAGITRVVFPALDSDRLRWADSANLATEYFRECGVRVDFV